MNQIQLFPKDNMGSTPPAEQQKSQYNDHVCTRPKEKGRFYALYVYMILRF